MAASNSLTNYDQSGFEFVQEMLDGKHTAAINFDRIQKHPKLGYIIFELLLCEESQQYVTPYTSHPKRYWNKNSRKFLSLYELALAIPAKLYLVNYAKKGTRHENEVLVIEVESIDETSEEHVHGKSIQYTRAGFQKWFTQLNDECL